MLLPDAQHQTEAYRLNVVWVHKAGRLYMDNSASLHPPPHPHTHTDDDEH